MNKHDVANELITSGKLSDDQVSRYRTMAELLAGLDLAGRDGIVALVKIDGERSEGEIYTVVLTGRKLGENYFRKDGSDLRDLLIEALVFCRSTLWSKEINE